MTRQQYRQIQRKRPELHLPDWSIIDEAKFIADRAALIFTLEEPFCPGNDPLLDVPF